MQNTQALIKATQRTVYIDRRQLIWNELFFFLKTTHRVPDDEFFNIEQYKFKNYPFKIKTIFPYGDKEAELAKKPPWLFNNQRCMFVKILS